MKHLVALAIFFIISITAFSQQATELKGIIYSTELSGGISVHTSGWGVFMDLGKREELKKKTVYQFEFTQIHSSKEVKQTIDFGFSFFGINSPKPFIYGKQNNFYLLNAAVGRQLMLSERAERSGVEVGVKLLGGLSLGLLKPYYLDLLYPVDNTQQYRILSEKYSEENAATFLDWFSIYGGSGFVYGLDEIKFIPGIHLKAGLNFDWATYDDFLKALEVGVIFDAYYKKVPIMIIDKNQQFFPNLYVSLQFGKKW
ncbi:MAG: hypothetical protein H0V61_08395 [Chitinophagales bacterium]|nr:hypothetical protein [Chitinophagales bacterium]